MNVLRCVLSTFFIILTTVATFPVDSSCDEPAVSLISPSWTTSGQSIPMTVAARAADGYIDTSVSGTYPLTINGGTSSFPIPLQRGMGYHSLQNPSTANVTLSVPSLGVSRDIDYIAIPPVIDHTTVSGPQEVWSGRQIHRVTGSITVPSGSELIIEADAIVLVAENASITVQGTIRVNGTDDRSVVFAPLNESLPWGGIEVDGAGYFTSCFFIGGGGDNSREFGHSHSQPVLLARYCEMEIDHCYIFENTGKALGGRESRITISHSLIARCDTGGEFMNGVTHISDTHVLDMPNDDGTFIDDDNDGLYFNGAPSSLETSLVERCTFITGKDDGIDHNGSVLAITGCWIEGFLHEGVAASNQHSVTIIDTVIKDCEQGIEAGYGRPEVIVDHCVVTGNDAGLRFGDSYAEASSGHMTVTNSILYGNIDNIRNYDPQSGGPIADGIDISYSMTNDSDYDASLFCITGTPVFTGDYYLSNGSPGYGAGSGGSSMGLIMDTSPSGLIINEILALNDGLYCDEYGEFDDWVEVYNPTGAPVDIGGMFITDDFTDPVKWRIPDDDPAVTTIPSGGFLILWMDGQHSQGPLHMDFSLSGAGEQIALFARDGATLVDGMTFEAQNTNVSYGRERDAAASWTAFQSPSPGLSNNPEPVVQEYYITCDPDDFAMIYDRYEEDILIPITFSHGSRTWNDVSMRIRGDTSREDDKKSLRIVFDSQPYSNGRDRLIFNAEFRDTSYMHQYLSSMLFRDSGHPCFEADFARLYLNGEFLGLYTAIENVDEDFLEARGLDPEGNLFKASGRGACLSIYDDIDTMWQRESNDPSGPAELRKLIDRINSVSDEEYYDFARANLDYDLMVNIIAINMLTVNASTYYHNYYMYQNPADKKWIMFPWDLDKTVSTYSWNYPYMQSGWDKYRTPDNPFPERALICEPILEDIIARIGELHDTIFNENRFGAVIDSLKPIIRASVLEDATDDIASLEQWETACENNRAFVESRYQYLQQQFSSYPRSFSVARPDSIFYDSVILTWRPSSDPNGDAISYTLKYSPDVNFPETTTTIFAGLTDTTFTLPDTPPEGVYYWAVSVTDGVNTVEGFGSRNIFTVSNKTQLPDRIESDMKLTKDGSPYVLPAGMYVPPGVTLSAEAGVDILIAPGFDIMVRGRLRLEGTAGDPVRLMCDVPDMRWGAICFDNGESGSMLRHVVIEDASHGEDTGIYGAAVSSLGTSVTLDNVRFSHVLKSISFDGGTLTASHCTFDADNAGEQIAVKNGGASITHCTIYDAPGDDAIDFEHVIDGVIVDCIINAAGDDGIDIGNGSERIDIQDVTIAGCVDKGISVGQTSTVEITTCVITTSDIGLAVFGGSQAYVDRVTFHDNTTTISGYVEQGGKIGGIITIGNSILTGSDEVLSLDGYSSAGITYSLFESNAPSGEGNISGDPRFVDPANGDFHLLPGSPCIDAGNPASETDPDGSRADLGAYPFSPASVIINEINYNSPADNDSGDWVELYNAAEYSIDVSGWALLNTNNDKKFVIPADTELGAGSYLVLCDDLESFRTIFPDIDVCMGNLGFGLSGKGETVRMVDAAGALMDSVTYDDVEPWPTRANGQNATLSLINPLLDNALASSWKASKGHGTPGARNDIYKPYDPHTSTVSTPLMLKQNYPNPFNVSTSISIRTLEACHVTVNIYAASGQKVARLFDGVLEYGDHIIVFDAGEYPSGVYFCRVNTGDFYRTIPMLLLK